MLLLSVSSSLLALCWPGLSVGDSERPRRRRGELSRIARALSPFVFLHTYVFVSISAPFMHLFPLYSFVTILFPYVSERDPPVWACLIKSHWRELGDKDTDQPRPVLSGIDCRSVGMHFPCKGRLAASLK